MRKLGIALKPLDIVCLVILAALAVMIFTTNVHTHLYSDGYLYSFKFNPGFVNGVPAETYYHKIHSPYEYYKSLHDIYFNLTGRIVPHGLLQFFLLFNPLVFDLFNTLALFLLPLIMVLWVLGKELKNVVPFWLLCFGLYYLAVSHTVPNLYLPAFSFNYVWTQIIVLCFLYPVRLQLSDSKPAKNMVWPLILIFVIGLIAGDTNERIIPAVLLAMGLYGLYLLIWHKRIPLWYFAAYGGLLLGYVFLVFAPGNAHPVATVDQYGSGVPKIPLNPQHLKAIAYMSINTLPAVLLAMLSILRFQVPRRKEDWYPLLLLLVILGGTIFALLFTPIRMPRINILFVGFELMICLYFVHYSRLATPRWLLISFLVISPFLLLKLNADSRRMAMADREYQLFEQELNANESDTVWVSPRAYLDPITQENWARPLAQYHHKRYIGVKDVLDSADVKRMQVVDYRDVSSAPVEGMKLSELGYLDVNGLSGTLYVIMELDSLRYPFADISLMVSALDLNKTWLRQIYDKLPPRLAALFLVEEPMYRPYAYRMIGSRVIYAIPLQKYHEPLDYLRIRITVKGIKLSDWCLRELRIQP